MCDARWLLFVSDVIKVGTTALIFWIYEIQTRKFICYRFACARYVMQILKGDQTAWQLINFFCDNVKLNSLLYTLLCLPRMRSIGVHCRRHHIAQGTWGNPDCNRMPFLTRKCVCCFSASVYKIQLEIMRLPVARPKFLYRPMANTGITFVWKMFPMKAYQLVTMFRQTLQNWHTSAFQNQYWILVLSVICDICWFFLVLGNNDILLWG